MLSKTKKTIGYIRRGAVGLVHNKREPIISIADAAESFVLGQSSQGRNILCYKLGNGGKLPIIIVGGIHGNEVGSIKFVSRLISWLPTQKSYTEKFTLYIVPCLNPDGLASANKNPDYWHGGLVGRFNGYNVDLNRNFDAPSFQSRSVWSRGKNYAETTEVFCGTAPFSEPETKALTNFILEHRINIYLAFHNAAADIMGNETDLSQTLAKSFSVASGYRFESNEDWQKLGQTGTAKEWCDVNNISYVEAEGRFRWSADWPHQLAGVKAVLDKLTSVS